MIELRVCLGKRDGEFEVKLDNFDLMLANDHSTMDSRDYGLGQVGAEPRCRLFWMFNRDRIGTVCIA